MLKADYKVTKKGNIMLKNMGMAKSLKSAIMDNKKPLIAGIVIGLVVSHFAGI